MQSPKKKYLMIDIEILKHVVKWQDLKHNAKNNKNKLYKRKHVRAKKLEELSQKSSSFGNKKEGYVMHMMNK